MTAQTLAVLQCPKCAGDLVTYERQGIHVDQCRECRGVWLDRGELDHLVDREAAAFGRAGVTPAGTAAAPTAVAEPRTWTPERDAYRDPVVEPRERGDAYRGRDDDRRDRDDDRRGRGDAYRGRDDDRRGGFLGDLLGDLLGG